MKQLVQRNPSFEPGWRVYYWCKDAALAYTLRSYYLCHSSTLIAQIHLDILYLPFSYRSNLCLVQTSKSGCVISGTPMAWHTAVRYSINICWMNVYWMKSCINEDTFSVNRRMSNGKYGMAVLSLERVIRRPRWLCARFPGGARLCNDYSLGNGLGAVPASLLGQGLTKALLSESPECQASPASSKQCGWPVSRLPSSVRTPPTLLLSVLCHQSPGNRKKYAQKCKTTLLLKELSEWERTMKWLESSGKTPRNGKIWNTNALWDLAS